MSDPELTPDQEARIRRLLAEARHADPVPGDVAARLDRVLAGLAQADGQVVDLAVRRRRRRVGGLLLAASAVVVAGIAVGQFTGDDASSRGEAAETPASQRQEAKSGGQNDAAAPEAAPSDEVPSTSSSTAALPDTLVEKVPPVSTRHFARDVARYRSLSRAEKDSRYQSTSDFVCEPADWGAGRLVPVLADGRPAVLVYRPPRGDSQVVDLLQCGSGDVLRSTTLPLR